jgi:ferritin-like metal-binding protein YciE
METLHDLYVEKLRDLYNAEGQILKAMPRMIKSASHSELKRAFTDHKKVTERQVTRLERIFKELGKKPSGKKCHGMEGLIEEAKELISEKPEEDVLDAGLIAAAQHVEHYEIAGYGTVRTYAEQLGYERQAELLQETLDEEGATDKLLTAIAQRSVNIDAEGGAEDGTWSGISYGRSTAGRSAGGSTSSSASRGGSRSSRKSSASRGGSRSGKKSSGRKKSGSRSRR